MSDNQSENSANWQEQWKQPPKLQPFSHEEHDRHVAAIRAAELDLETAIAGLHQAEHALEEAKRTVKIAEGRLYLIKEQPTWRDIFDPKVFLSAEATYTQCVQAGYQYALWNDRVFRVGKPSEQLIDTGAKADDIK